MKQESAWKYVSSTAAGSSHSLRNQPCQDYCILREFSGAEPTLLLVASDGAGSAKRSEVGSKLVCDSIHTEVTKYLQQYPDISKITEDLIRCWLEESVRRDLSLQAAAENLDVREFACTLVAALIGSNNAIFVQIGDGAIVIREGISYSHVFWPQNGEYANSTYFVSDEQALDNLQFTTKNHSPTDEVAIFTDGLQSLALKFDTKTAHQPFFHPLFARLRQEPPGESELLAPLLTDFLNSHAVNERTDDDKTLLLATRLPADLRSFPIEDDQSTTTL